MARIDSEGPVEEKKVVCPNCRYRIAYTPVDVEERQHTDYSGTTDTYWSLRCPKCQHRIELSFKQAH